MWVCCMSVLGLFWRSYVILLPPVSVLQCAYITVSSFKALKAQYMDQISQCKYSSQRFCEPSTSKDKRRQLKRDEEMARWKSCQEAMSWARSGAAAWHACSQLIHGAYRTRASRKSFKDCSENKWQRPCVGFSGDLPTLKRKNVKNRKVFAFPVSNGHLTVMETSWRRKRHPEHWQRVELWARIVH